MSAQPLQNYQPKLIDLFKAYLKNKDLNALVKGVKELDATIRRHLRLSPKNKQSLWWRYFANDTGANMVTDLQTYLANPTSNNGKYTIECMEIAVNDNAAILYYS